MDPSTRPPLQQPPSSPQTVPHDFGDRLAALGVTMPAPALLQLGDFLGRLLAMNELVNLISRVDPANAWDRHIFDSLTLLPQLQHLGPGARLLDVGSGGGLPGMPIAIARSDLSVTLLDATQKKVRFLRDVADAMGLSNVSTETGRAEKLAKGELAASFDVVTARAVSGMSALVRLTAPFLRAGGRLLLTKGQKAEQELAEATSVLRKLRLTLVEVVPTNTGRIVVLERGSGN